MKKYIGSKLRESEDITKCEPVIVWIKNKSRECQLALVCNKQSEFELA